MTSNYALLTGAGYSKNWDGWLSSEFWNVILSHSLVQQNQDLKNIIWDYRERGFEEAFSDKRIKDKFATHYQQIIKDSFILMHKAIAGSGRIPISLPKLYIGFIYKFDCFFTLNPDLFFEALHPIINYQSIKYFYPHVKSRNYFQYNLPRDLTVTATSNLDSLILDATLVPDTEPYNYDNNPLEKISHSNPQIPKPLKYYKLHGSLNFKDGDKNMMVMGGSKPEQIKEFPLLEKYHNDFEIILKLSKKLMIIGYSFSDHHINDKIFNAVENNNLKFWIIDICDLGRLIENAVYAKMCNIYHQWNTEKDEKPPIVTPHNISERHKLEPEIRKQYTNYFKTGLISITKSSLSEIFTGSLLERRRIEEQFFS